MNTQRKYEVFDGTSGLRLMPRNNAGREISKIDWLIVTIRMPSVVFDKAIHLEFLPLPSEAGLSSSVRSPTARRAPRHRWLAQDRATVYRTSGSRGRPRI